MEDVAKTLQRFLLSSKLPFIQLLGQKWLSLPDWQAFASSSLGRSRQDSFGQKWHNPASRKLKAGFRPPVGQRHACGLVFGVLKAAFLYDFVGAAVLESYSTGQKYPASGLSHLAVYRFMNGAFQSTWKRRLSFQSTSLISEQAASHFKTGCVSFQSASLTFDSRSQLLWTIKLKAAQS
jgi:hypothetical protein